MTRDADKSEALQLLMSMCKVEDNGGGAEMRHRCEALRLKQQRMNNGAEKALRVGMLAQWKQGMKNRGYPDYGEPAVVVEILEQPAFDAREGAATNYFREPLDLLLGLIMENGIFCVFHFDSRRFEPFPDAEQASAPKASDT